MYLYQWFSPVFTIRRILEREKKCQRNNLRENDDFLEDNAQ